MHACNKVFHPYVNVHMFTMYDVYDVSFRIQHLKAFIGHYISRSVLKTECKHKCTSTLRTPSLLQHWNSELHYGVYDLAVKL